VVLFFGGLPLALLVLQKDIMQIEDGSDDVTGADL
jgi:hypothetical protein